MALGARERKVGRLARGVEAEERVEEEGLRRL